MLHSEEAYKKYKKQLLKDGIRIQDVRPYEEAHPVCDKIQTGCRRWGPVVALLGSLAGPAALLGAGKLAESKQEVKVAPGMVP